VNHLSKEELIRLVKSMNGMDTSMDVDDFNTAMIEENIPNSSVGHNDDTLPHIEGTSLAASATQPAGNDHQEAIAQLCAISGADPDIASDVLSVRRLSYILIY
jgi:hypothetical protein